MNLCMNSKRTQLRMCIFQSTTTIAVRRTLPSPHSVDHFRDTENQRRLIDVRNCGLPHGSLHQSMIYELARSAKPQTHQFSDDGTKVTMSGNPPPAGFNPQGRQFPNPIGYYSGGQSVNLMGSAPSQMGASYGPNSAYYCGHPTVVPAPNFDPGQDADELRKAMRGLGTDEDRIIAVLSKRTSAQRNEIVNKYRASFGKDLKKDLKSELSGKFEDVVLASIMDLPTMLATSLYNAMKGAGTKEWVLIQVLVPYSNAIVKATVEAYHKSNYAL
ncbi:unnamed protein product [Mesocestoides corti]|uniref:Annexin n=2 Tax=Mesocestoides corti TaxID=53468 RepID=A0A0R3UAX6_MESCO|nr:unnamed protein product [Mesocestoides corti]